MNLTAYDCQGNALFTRQVTNKTQAQQEILNNGYLVRVCWFIFKRVKYPIQNVYKPVDQWSTILQ